MAKAIWNGAVLAESTACIIVEGDHYFPPDAIRRQYFKPSATHTTCPWKGEASYYDVSVNGVVNKDAAWYYPAPKDAAKKHHWLCRILERHQGGGLGLAMKRLAGKDCDPDGEYRLARPSTVTRPRSSHRLIARPEAWETAHGADDRASWDPSQGL